MAEEPKSSEWEVVALVVGIIVVLIAVWIARGAPLDPRMMGGIFITPNGVPYGPKFSTSTPPTTNNNQ